MTDQPMPEQAARDIVDAVLADSTPLTYATQMPSEGDLALVVRKNGGVEMLSIMADNPDKDTFASLGVRGLFLMALARLAHDRDLMVAVIRTVDHEINRPGAVDIKMDS